jgi:hypothetical protein
MNFKYLRNFIAFLILIQLTNSAFANRRHFAYTTESAVLPNGAHELELWNTVRLNRKDFFRGFDNRSEFEFGLGGNFQTSLYLNLSNELDAAGNSDQSFGFSTEAKYQALDAHNDPIGLALYAETGYSNSETELEGKIILDKYAGKFLFAVNAIGEHSFVTGKDAADKMVTQTEDVAEFDGGAAFFITHNFTVGLEAREHIKHPPGIEGGGVYSALFAGPSLSYDGPNWWTAVSIMPQIGTPELAVHEKLEARLLLSFEF